MAGVHEYKCPCCGGGIVFDSAVQKMKCPYCDTEFEISTLEAYDEELEKEKEKKDDLAWGMPQGAGWAEGETDGLFRYSCTSCGAEVIGDKTLAASKCPYCDNPMIMMDQFRGDLKPDYVIPFKLDKEAAKKKLYEHLKGKKLLPKLFKDQNHIDEIKGVYAPFWLYDASCTADARYKATKVRTWMDARNTYTATSYFNVTRSGELYFKNIPVDCSTKIQDDLMESIEPYDFSAMVDFKTAYLSGYLADKYDVESAKSMERVNQRVRFSAESSLRNSVVGYSSVSSENASVRITDSSVKYALLPVWILNTTWQGKHYLFAMNGQTGKFVGDLPVDNAAANMTLIKVAAAISLIGGLILTFIF